MGTYCRYNLPIVVLSLALVLSLFPATVSAQLRPDYYARTCPNVESIVRAAVEKKVKQTFISVPGVIRLLFHDCFVQGCDASVIIVSTPTNKAEKDHPDNLSLNGDGFDTVIQAKAAVDKVPGCRNKVSCADILVMAARDAIKMAGGPSYGVELGRLDGLVSTAASVNGKLPKPTFNLNQLNSIFSANGLTQTDMIALSAAHTVGFAHCNQFANRIGVDPTLNKTYAAKLKVECPRNVDPRVAVTIDPTTKNTFDNVYFKNLQNHMGLFSSDQVLYQDQRSKPTVDTWAHDTNAFQRSFVAAITKLARVGVKTGRDGEVRRSCAAFN